MSDRDLRRDQNTQNVRKVDRESFIVPPGYQEGGYVYLEDGQVKVGDLATEVTGYRVITDTPIFAAEMDWRVPREASKSYYVYIDQYGKFAVDNQTPEEETVVGKMHPNRGERFLGFFETGTDLAMGNPVSAENYISGNQKILGNVEIGGTLGVTGAITLASLTASQAVFTDASKVLVSNAITGTGNVVMSASPTLTGTIDAASMTLSGTLGVTGATTLSGLLVQSVENTTVIQIDNTKADGDPYLAFALSGTKVFTIGVDDGDGDKLKIGTTAIGTNERLTISSTEMVVNDDSNDFDFRIESNSDAHALFLRGSDGNLGLGASNPTSPGGVNKFLHIKGSSASIVLEDSDATTWEWLSAGGNLKAAEGGTDYFIIDTVGAVQMGTPGTNYTQIEADGTLEFNGTATVFDDLLLPITITKLGVTAPSWTSFFGNLSQYTFAVDDYVEGSIELLHGYKEGSNLDVHLHIVTQGAEASVEVNYSFEYWIADMGEASTGTTTISSGDYTLTNADGHHEYIDIGDITGTGFKIGAVICFVLTRIDLVDGSDPASDPFVVSVGIHYEQDTIGSRTETAK